jgi:hypothetical protein
VQAEDAERLAVARSKHQMEEEERAAKRRISREARRVAKAQSAVTAPSPSQADVRDAASERARPASTSAPSVVLPLGSRKLIGSSRGQASKSSGRGFGQQGAQAPQGQARHMGGARASAAARTRSHVAWGKKLSVLETSSKKFPFKGKMPTGPSKPLPTMKTAQKYLKVRTQPLSGRACLPKCQRVLCSFPYVLKELGGSLQDTLASCILVQAGITTKVLLSSLSLCFSLCLSVSLSFFLSMRVGLFPSSLPALSVAVHSTCRAMEQPAKRVSSLLGADLYVFCTAKCTPASDICGGEGALHPRPGDDAVRGHQGQDGDRDGEDSLRRGVGGALRI